MAVSDDIVVSQSGSHAHGDAQAVELPLGEVFSAARIAKKLTQQDVSEKLRYSVKQIDALENNKFDVLPDAMITRGFIRNYAKLLEIDAEPLLANYRDCMPDKQLAHLSVHTSMREVSLTKESLPWLNYILGAIVVLLFLLAWFFYMDYRFKEADVPSQAEQKPPVEAADSSVELTLPEVALPVAERASEYVANANGGSVDVSDIVASPDGAVADARVANQTLSSDSSVAQSPANEAEITQAVSQPALDPVIAGAKKMVSFSASEQTWVSVTDKSGRVVFEKTLSAGSTDSFEGLPPLSVVVGNAKATQMSYAGKPVALSAPAGSNVARIRLE